MTDLKGILKILGFCACCLVGTQSATAGDPPEGACLALRVLPDESCVILTGRVRCRGGSVPG